MEMATLVTIPSTFTNQKHLHAQGKAKLRLLPPLSQNLRKFRVRAAKIPSGVEIPKIEPKLTEPFLGFTNTAEIWNSRACMIGIVGTFIVELIFHRGILQMIGVDVGKATTAASVSSASWGGLSFVQQQQQLATFQLPDATYLSSNSSNNRLFSFLGRCGVFISLVVLRLSSKSSWDRMMEMVRRGLYL